MNQVIKKQIDAMLDDWILSEDVVVNTQAQENLIYINLAQEEGNFFSEEEVEEMFSYIVKAYENKNHGGGKKLYFWYDALAGQLRVSAVDCKVKKLPFGCIINENAGFNHIYQDIYAPISSLYGKGVLDVCVVEICPVQTSNRG
jgi:hypothetical protein